MQQFPPLYLVSGCELQAAETKLVLMLIISLLNLPHRQFLDVGVFSFWQKQMMSEVSLWQTELMHVDQFITADIYKGVTLDSLIALANQTID